MKIPSKTIDLKRKDERQHSEVKKHGKHSRSWRDSNRLKKLYQKVHHSFRHIIFNFLSDYIKVRFQQYPSYQHFCLFIFCWCLCGSYGCGRLHLQWPMFRWPQRKNKDRWMQTNIFTSFSWIDDGVWNVWLVVSPGYIPAGVPLDDKRLQKFIGKPHSFAEGSIKRMNMYPIQQPINMFLYMS